ncbi:GumC family protein [Allopontixanthobacter sediminis]|uniref:Lipopolysaccharide biosynthesis protein n=1 Tax=Allopontixanthobacter sediminis TaxID=1689985 RepID=A0A845B529_9SPHN|nr:Wzz/FepE/Etk N-terminal domain-containing protein [Allopontixanthobacter sediminis]MXP44632.1 lipopolysaccharide biosynthesis protein [Allopontixanthobacter sediminis]
MSDAGYDNEEDQGGNLLAHLPTILKERYRWLLVPTILCLIAGIAASFLLPEVYRSTATLLVESPQLPEDVIGTQELDIVDQRIAKIRQQVLSRPRLIELIQKHRLYNDEKAGGSLSEIIEEMRDATTIEAVSSEFQGGGRAATIAFALNFDYKAAPQAQAVAQDMTEQILLIDATKSSEQAANTVQFLTDQATALQSQIGELEATIETIKAQNGLALSSAGTMFMGGSGSSYDAQIIAFQRDNALLAAQREARKSSPERDPVVAGAEAELAAARARYSDDHPDIAFAKRRLAEAKRLAESKFDKLPADTIDQQISSNNAQIAALQSAKAQEIGRLATAQSAQARAPLVQEEIAQQQQKLEALNTQYEGVSTRLLAAQASSKAESEQKGERLSVIDPPVVPDSPRSPNRPLLIAGGLAFGLGLGLFLVLLVELYYRPIRDMLDIRAVTGSMPLVSIPTIDPVTTDRPTFFKRLLRFFPFPSRALHRTNS